MFRDMGPDRTVEGAYRQHVAADSSKSRRPTGQWYKRVKQHDWTARASAWDAHKREQRETRREGREERQAAAEDRFVDDQMDRRRQRVATISSLADRLLSAALTAMPVTDGQVALPDENAMKAIDRAEKLAKLAQEESRRECQVSDETLARLIELAKGVAR